MTSATYFGEVTELDSRAVWYSDEEDDDEDDSSSRIALGRPFAVDEDVAIRSNLSLSFERLQQITSLDIKQCIISLSSASSLKNYKTDDPSVILLGIYKNLGKVFLCALNDQKSSSLPSESILWLLFDQSASMITGMEISYFVEVLREHIYQELGLNASTPVIILAKQFSAGEHLEYLSNHSVNNPDLVLPFSGRSILPPALIRNSFESALFEQLTLTLKLAYVVCLPDPRNYSFDKTLYWPDLPNQIIGHKLNDNNLEKTLIFI